jgi:hypothetical protein
VIERGYKIVAERPLRRVRSMTREPCAKIRRACSDEAVGRWATESGIKSFAKLREVPLRCTALVAHQPVGVCKRRSEWDRLGATATPTLLPAARNERMEATIWRRDQRCDPRRPLNLCRTDHKVRRTDLIESKLLRCRRLNAV